MWRRRLSRAEIEALAEACRHLSAEAEQALAVLRHERNTRASRELVARGVAAVHQAFDKSRRRAGVLIDDRVDASFCIDTAAAWAGEKVGKPDWGACFEERSASLQAELEGLDRQRSERVGQIVEEQLGDVIKRYGNLRAPSWSDPTRRVLDGLSSRGRRRMFAGYSGTDALIGALGAVMAAEGGLILVVSQVSTASSMVKWTKRAIEVLMPLEVQELLLHALLDFIVEQVGEELLADVATAIGLAMTGIGAFLAVWKVGRAVWLVKRIFVDHEPLVKLRHRILESYEDHLEKGRAMAIGALRRSYVDVLERVEVELETVRDEAIERLTWASRRLGDGERVTAA